MQITLSESFHANKEIEEELFVSFEEKPLGMSALAVPSHLKALAQLVSTKDNGDLTMIDAILGCPVILPDMECKDFVRVFSVCYFNETPGILEKSGFIFAIRLTI